MLKVTVSWSEMTLNYQRTVERYPKPNGVAGGSFPSYGNFCTWQINCSGDHEPHVLQNKWINKIKSKVMVSTLYLKFLAIWQDIMGRNEMQLTNVSKI